MSHYLPNLRDLEFNLFEIHRVHEYSPIDRSTAEDLVREAARFAAGPWAQSFEASDRAPLLLEDGEVSLPPALLSSLRKGLEGGWDRVGLPSELGGVPVPSVLFWCLQDLFLGANPAAAFYSTGPYFASILYAEGTDEQKQLARLMVERAWGATMVLTEPDAGSDVGAATTKAIPVGDDTYHLEGVKRFITSGEHDASENIIHFVLARPVGAVAGTKGLSLFVVPKFLVKVDGTLGERNGVKATRLEHKLGLRGSATCELTFGQDRPAVGFLLGGVHDGIRQMFRVIEHARMTIGAKSAATLSTGYLNALGYARERVQGPDLALATDKSSPRVPILRHPDVRRMLMLQKCHSEGMRALLTYAAWTKDQADLHPGDESWRSRFELLLPLVKGYSSEKAFELLALSLQVLGGSGYTEDYPIEQYLRDAKIDSIYEGTTGIQALDLFFRKIARDRGTAIAALSADIHDFCKSGPEGDRLAGERELLMRMLEECQGQLGVLVDHLLAFQSDPDRIYLVGLHANAQLESLAELVIAWQLLRHAEVALADLGYEADPFLQGKVASARFFVRHALPLAATRRTAAFEDDGAIMQLADDSW